MTALVWLAELLGLVLTIGTAVVLVIFAHAMAA
jgi:hypothetical protein